jgi:hypothetical protein
MTASQFGRFLCAFALALSCSTWSAEPSTAFSFQDVYETLAQNGNVDAVLTALYLEASTDRDRNFVVSLAGGHRGEKTPKWRIEKNKIVMPGERAVSYVIEKYTFGFRVADSFWYFDQRLSLEENLNTLNRFLETPGQPAYLLFGVGASILCLTKDVPFCVARPLLSVASMVAPASAEPLDNPLKHLRCVPAAPGKHTLALTYANGNVHDFAFRATGASVESIVKDRKPADMGGVGTYGVMLTDNVCQDPKKLAAMNITLEKLAALWPFSKQKTGITK